MAFELNDMSGSLWVNDRKTKDNQPSHQGSIKIDGVEYWMSAWVKKTNTGKKFFSMAFTKKDDQPSGTTSNPNRNSQPKSGMDDFDEDVPF